MEAGSRSRSVLATAFFAAPVAVGMWAIAWVEIFSALGLAGSRIAWAVFWGATATSALAALAGSWRAVRIRPVPRSLLAALAVPAAVL
ncbi:MAG: hypothetical protein ACXVID_07940, partial [Thermoanaerobaculia bacterium]